MNASVKFDSIADEYGEFSNFVAYPVKIGSRTWPAKEHYFRLMKFTDRAHLEEIPKANPPMLAARLG